MRPSRRLFSPSLLILLAHAAWWVSSAAATEPLQVRRATAPIAVDGNLEDTEWGNALALPLPFEFLPNDNTPALVETTGYITFTSTHLYVAWRCLDPDPQQIRAHLTDRDDVATLSRDDHVVLLLDSFNDERRAVQLRVNPFGVQADALTSEPYAEDFSYDLIWKSAARITDDGWTAEIAVPFAQLRFPGREGEQTWGVSLHRSWPRNVRHRTATQKRDRNLTCILCQISKVRGFEGLKPGRNLEIAPTLTGLRNERLESFGQTADSTDELDAGLSMRWSPTPNWTLNGAVNPDFSQVEADAAQLAVNQRFALFFREQRPFFLEGSDLFTTPIQAVFTRTVRDPDWGLKLTSKQGANALGVFTAGDAANGFVLPGNQFSQTAFLDEEVSSGVVRYRRDVGVNSSVGMLWAGREGDGPYSNHVYGLDTYLLLDSKHQIQAQYLRSRTRYPGQISTDFSQPFGAFEDDALQLGYNYNSRDWQNWLWFEERGEGFRADSGFVPQVDYRSVNGGVLRRWWGEPGDTLREQTTFVRYKRSEQESTGLLNAETVDAEYFLAGPLQSLGLVSVRYGRERFLDVVHENLFEVSAFGSFQPTGDLQFDLWASYGDEIDLVNNRVGDQWVTNTQVRWRPGRRLNLFLDHTTQSLHLPTRLERGQVTRGGDIFEVQLTQLRTVYNLDVRNFVRLVLQYQDLRRDVALYPFEIEPEEDTLLVQFLYSFILNPQTVIFAGYSENRLGIQGVTLEQTDRQFFVKLGYAWLP
ncbi:MAG: DUF5916 domain-containing protein [Acidobacteriota bacterium]